MAITQLYSKIYILLGFASPTFLPPSCLSVNLIIYCEGYFINITGGAGAAWLAWV